MSHSCNFHSLSFSYFESWEAHVYEIATYNCNLLLSIDFYSSVGVYSGLTRALSFLALVVICVHTIFLYGENYNAGISCSASIYFIMLIFKIS